MSPEYSMSNIRPILQITPSLPRTRRHRRQARRRRASVASTTACACFDVPICTRSAGWRTASASGGTWRARTTTSTCGSKRPTSASPAVCSVRSRACSPATPRPTRCRSSRCSTSCASAPHQPLTEVHVVNGLHPDLPFATTSDLLRGLKAIRPGIHLKCFTAVEIAFFAETLRHDRRSRCCAR